MSSATRSEEGGGVNRAALPLSVNQVGCLVREWWSAAISPPCHSLALTINGPLDAARFRRALATVVRRHELLRSAIVGLQETGFNVPALVRERLIRARGRADQLTALVADGTFMPRGPVVGPHMLDQFAIDCDAVDLRCRDLNGGPIEETVRAAAAELAADADYEQPPHLRAAILTAGAADHVAVVSIPVSMSDGWSLRVLETELADAYRVAADGHAGPDRAIVRYRDFAARQWNDLSSGEFDRQLNFWRARWATLKAPVGLREVGLPSPDDRQPSTATTVEAPLDDKESSSVVERARQLNVSLYVLGLSALVTAIAARTGFGALPIGVYCANRSMDGTADMLGHFITTHFVQLTIQKADSMLGLLDVVHEAVMEVLAHQSVSYMLHWVRPDHVAPIISFDILELGRAYQWDELTRVAKLFVPSIHPNASLDVRLLTSSGSLSVFVRATGPRALRSELARLAELVKRALILASSPSVSSVRNALTSLKRV